MRQLSALLAAAILVGTALAPSAAPAPGVSRGGIAVLVGTWTGHTAYVKITSNGIGKESVGSGCCDPVIDLTFRISNVKGTGVNATAIVKALSVRLHDWGNSTKPPHVGQVARLTVHGGVLTDGLTGFGYCGLYAQKHSPLKCGA